MQRHKPIVLGNWKMNGLRAEGDALIRDLIRGLADRESGGMLGVCPPATLLAMADGLLSDSDIILGGQDCSVENVGAFTGDISAPMLSDAGCSFTLVGHSERRHGHGETDAIVKAKAEAAHRAGLDAVVCIGETETEWDAGETLSVLDRQLEGSLPETGNVDNVIVAYEPVWAIGTGKTPTMDDIATTHAHLRAKLRGLVTGGDDIALLYGGSVKAANAADILSIDNVDGALVGGASLKADEFLAILDAGQVAKAA
jgi:triosephosphate isomerase